MKLITRRRKGDLLKSIWIQQKINIRKLMKPEYIIPDMSFKTLRNMKITI